MYNAFSDTIFALATGATRAALSVIRVSGPGCEAILNKLCGSVPPARRASLRTLRTSDGACLDQGLVIWFPGPASYTGEDCCELHLHGGVAVLHGVVRALAEYGARPAEAGEFTRRAVTHGRIDLLEAEAVADLIAAETFLQRDQALRQLGGALGTLAAGWAKRLLQLLAQQEALIDFPDEDLPPEMSAALRAEIADLHQAIEDHLRSGEQGERLRTGLVLAIAGAPNSGKSTLMNALCRREIAIVSPSPGTTRDILEARLEIAGIPVTILDTAGLRDTEEFVEAEGVRRARARIETADLVLVLRAHDAPDEDGEPAITGRALYVRTKTDLGHDPSVGLAISAVTGSGMDRLTDALASEVVRLAGLTGNPAFTRARHRAALSAATTHLACALDADLPELRGEELRSAMQAIGRLTGAVGVEDVLDSVFSQFCIGK